MTAMREDTVTMREKTALACVVLLLLLMEKQGLAFDEDGWVTMNGTPVKLDGKGKAVAGPENVVAQGEKQPSAKSLDQKRDAVSDAMNEIANGKREATIPNLRDDLERYGGTNDVTIERGNEKSGLEHIARQHGHRVIPGVLEAVIDGKILRYVKSNQTVILRKKGYEAVLSLNKHGGKKTWLLTGFDLPETAKDEAKRVSGGHGKFSPRHMPTHAGPMFSRPGMGAESPFAKIVAQIFRKSKFPGASDGHIALDAATRRALGAVIKNALARLERRVR